MLRVLPFCLAYTLPLLVILSGQGGWAMLAIPILTYILVPILDIVSGIDLFNPSSDNEKELRDNLFFRFITWFWVPVGLSLTAYGMWWVLQPGRTIWDVAGMIIAVGITNGVIGITFAHELMHKSDPFEQFLAEVLMMVVSYPHFCIQHILGHHKKVGTFSDPATARFGEDIYSFYLRTVSTGYWSAWVIEFKRLAKLGLPFWQNRMLRYSLTLAIIYLAIGIGFGWLAVVFFASQSIIAFLSLETTNYMEHYGLARKEISPGVYERTLPKHSWNSGHRISNWFLINLARHSDHHFIASKRYQILNNFQDTAPQLPFGYGTMFLVALVPPFWFRIMNPRVLAWSEDKFDVKRHKPLLELCLNLRPIDLLMALAKASKYCERLIYQAYAKLL
jgi:alkane 1-monooxygenase